MTRCRRYFPVLALLLSACLPCKAADSQTPDTYWRMPIPAQQPTPPAPEACASCHNDKYTDWSGSRHAHAFSAGLLGQVVDYQDTDVIACLNCHAPLAEQQRALLQSDLDLLAADMLNHQTDLLTGHGVFCAACHLRDGTLNAPSITAPAGTARVHQAVRVEPLLRDSRFCSGCHQFDATASVNGKPLQNTYREWLDSPFAEQNKTCQYCHMPNGAHSFRGIHDPDMVRQGLTITTRSTSTSSDLIVSSTDIGHHFPTYSVARVLITGTPVDRAGRNISAGYREKIIQRRVSTENGYWIELSDTRLEPGKSVILAVPWQIDGLCADRIVFRIFVEPEWFYHHVVYPAVIDELEDSPARDLVIQAMAQSRARQYTLYETVVSNSCD